jgi:hypothetical protein
MSSPFRMFGAETPMKTSAPASAPLRSPLYFAALVFSAIQRSSGDSPSRSGWITPPMSATQVSFTPAASSSFRIAVPAAPAPDSTTRTLLMSLPTTRSAL